MTDITRVNDKKGGDDPRVVAFLNSIRDTENERDDLREYCARISADLSLERMRIRDLQTQNRTLTAERNRYMRSSVALQTHIRDVAATCQSAIQSAIEAERMMAAEGKGDLTEAEIEETKRLAGRLAPRDEGHEHQG